MMVLITAGARAQDGKPSALFESMVAYSGRYRLQGDSLVTKVDSACLGEDQLTLWQGQNAKTLTISRALFA